MLHPINFYDTIFLKNNRKKGLIMKHSKKSIRSYCLLILLSLLLAAAPAASDVLPVSAHSGRTDGNGGHHDYRNVSGLGSYHYHCGGHPAHLHSGGVCPYSRPQQPSTPRVKLKLNKKKAALTAGSRMTLKLNVKASKASWKSSNKKVASVSKQGVITAKKAGKAVISAKYSGQTVKCTITVKKPQDVVIKTVGWSEYDSHLRFKITNNTNKPLLIQQELKAYDDDYRYFGSLYAIPQVISIPAKSTKTVIFYDHSEDESIIYYTQQFSASLTIKGVQKTCYALYQYDDDVPYRFVIK